MLRMGSSACIFYSAGVWASSLLTTPHSVPSLVVLTAWGSECANSPLQFKDLCTFFPFQFLPTHIPLAPPLYKTPANITESHLMASLRYTRCLRLLHPNHCLLLVAAPLVATNDAEPLKPTPLPRDVVQQRTTALVPTQHGNRSSVPCSSLCLLVGSRQCVCFTQALQVPQAVVGTAGGG